MTDAEVLRRLGKIEMRQEALIAAVGELGELMGDTRDLIVKLQEWAQEPPSTDLGDTLVTLTQAISGLHEAIVTLGQEMPGRVAAALS